MYGGDEISAIVIDVGSSSTKAGWAGEDSPKADFVSDVGVIVQPIQEGVVGESQKAMGEQSDVDPMDTGALSKMKAKYFLGSNSLWLRRDDMEIKKPMEKGLVSDWDVLEQIWDFGLKESLRIDPAEHPILLAEPSFNTKPIREKMTELMFEKYGVPALFLSKNAVLTSFSCGKSSSLVLDCGAATTSITPVHDGYALQKCLTKSFLAGDRLTTEYRKLLEQKKVMLNPHYIIESKKEIRPGEYEVKLRDVPRITKSYHNYHVNRIVRDIKETVCRVSDTAFDEEANANIPTVPYELPDGNVIDLGPDRFKIPELLFNPSSLEDKEEIPSLHNMVYSTIAKCDPDTRREFFNSIIVTGGTTLLPQFPERLNKELIDKSPPQMYKVRIVASNSPVERKYSPWIGGSILASLGTFQQMWCSKQEYEEFGRSMVERKCP